MSSVQGGTHSFSAGTRQKFTPEYLAKQLPMFQERIPRASQEPLKYPTDAPSNLPLPPVLPGETILLKQHRVACLETFSEPAVGSLYITNFRLVFNGNSLSDPESREAMQEGLPLRKEHAFTLDSGKLPRMRNTRPAATFNSYLTDPDQAPASSSSKWMRLNSLRRTNRSASDNTLSTRGVRKSSSLRRSPLQKKEQESTDNEPTGGGGGGGGGGVLGEIGSLVHRGARSLHIPNKRRGVVQRESGGIQWDSVSSISSISEGPTTGTDEMSERETVASVSPVPLLSYDSPVFSVGSMESPTPEVLLNGSGVGSSGVPHPDTPPNSLDSGVIADPLSGSWAGSLGGNGSEVRGTGNGNTDEEEEEIDFEKYSAAMLDPLLKTDTLRRELEASVNPALFLDPQLERQRQEMTRRSWFHKSTSSPTAVVMATHNDGVEEGAESVSSDNEDDNDTNQTLTLDPSSSSSSSGGTGVFQVGYSKVEIITSEDPPLNSDSTPRVGSPVYSTPVKMTGRGLRGARNTKEVGEDKKEEGAEDGKGKAEDCVNRERAGGGMKVSPSITRKPLPPAPPPKKVPHAATRLALLPSDERESSGEVGEKEEAGRGGGYANFAILRGLTDQRDRSLSIPSPLKKPMPLPRKAGMLGRADETGRGLGQSLPANFKPTPPPRKPTLVSSPSGSPQTSRSQQPPSRRRPPVLPKPSLTLPRTKPRPSLPRSRTPPNGGTLLRPSPPTPHKPKTTIASSSHHTGEERAAEDASSPGGRLANDPREVSPVAPPRRKRKSQTTPTHQKTPIVSPAHSSPEKTIGPASSDAGSTSDLPETSSESDLSHSRSKLPPLPSPAPHSPTPSRESTPPPLDWHDDSNQDSSMVAHRSSILSSLHSPLPPYSPGFLDPSTPGFVGETAYPTSSHAVPSSSSMQPTSTRYTYSCSVTLLSIHSVKKQPAALLKEDGLRLPEGISVLTRNFRSLKLHVHPRNSYDAEGVKDLLEKKILVEPSLQDLFAFHYCAAIRHPNPNFLHTTSLPNFFKLQDPELTPSYPRQVVVPRCIPDLDLLRGAKLYRQGRFPTLAWCRRGGGVFLLRAAPTLSHRGHSGGTDMRLDEAILQAVCVSTETTRGSTKLYIFTEKPDSTPTALSDPMHTGLTAAQKRAYYYHNCQFEYIVSPPTFKNVRHSFRKLSALLEENKVGEDEFLIALDDTQWLYRVQELLQTAAGVVGKLEEERASVLVSYDSGWDRTTQITSLAQLLLDPFYRTMNGFQILVQKEWLWFGHPFESRHTRHGRVKDDGPVFLQWVDCVWQIFHQCPSAFEFNEKFLMVMVESSYSGQFGTFLLNSEQERHKTLDDEAHKHKSVATHTLSFWTWVAMVNAAGRTFFNHLYDPHTYPWVIYPNCTVPCLKLWTRHYSQSKYQEHLEHSANTTPLQKQLDQLVREYQMLSSKTEVGISPRPPTIALPPAIADKEPQRNSFRLERERERVRQSGRSSRSRTPAHCQNIQEYLKSQGIDCSVCKHAVIVGNTCQGLLVKLGGVRKHWQERWFVLDFASQLLTYFENKEEFTTTDRGTPKGVIELTNMTKVWQNDRKKDHLVRHVFTVVTKDRTYLFRAPSLLTMQLWIAVLNMPRTTVQLDT